MKFIFTLAFLVLSCVLITGCGSGSGDAADTVPPTRRPKTLDGLKLTIASNATVEFVRGSGSPPALLSGDVETGTFFYNLTGTNLKTPALDNLMGGRSTVQFPNLVVGANYTYRAINENQAVLTLTAVGELFLPITGTITVANASFMALFIADSLGNENNTVEFDLSFASNGETIEAETSTMIQVGSPSGFDRVRAPLSIRLVDGDLVPEDYNPEIDPLRPSRLAPESLTDSRFQFTNTGFGDPAFDFSIQFAGDVNITGDETIEIGTGLLRVGDSVVDDAIDYTWARTPGTDAGTLVVSNSGLTFDGAYTLDFFSPDEGTYVGEEDADTADINELIGTFNVR